MLIKWTFFLCTFFLFLLVAKFLPAAEKNEIKVIVFDFGSVIAKTDKELVAQFIAETLHISKIEALNSLKQLKEEGENGKKEKDFWIDYASANQINLPPQWQEKLDAVKLHSTREVPGMVQLVKDLKKQGYQIALLSNILQCQAAIKRRTGLYDLFHPLLLSYAIEVKKPNLKAYEILLKTLEMPPQSVIFIDNKKENIEAAKSLGIDSILFFNRDQLVGELKTRGIEIYPS